MRKFKVFILVAVMLVSWNSAFAQVGQLKINFVEDLNLNSQVDPSEPPLQDTVFVTVQYGSTPCQFNKVGNIQYQRIYHTLPVYKFVDGECNWITFGDATYQPLFDIFYTSGTAEVTAAVAPIKAYLPIFVK